MEVEFMTADTPPAALYAAAKSHAAAPDQQHRQGHVRPDAGYCFPVGIEDANGILFIHFPIVELAAALARSTMTVKRPLNELEDAGLILRVRQGFGKPNKIYVLIPKKEDSRL